MWRMSSVHRRRSAIVCRGALLLGALFASCPFAFALDPALTISQYAHTAWRSRNGFTEGVIQAIAQTDDGYLWLGTTLGLLRFDGVRVTPWHAVSGQLPSTHISTLLSARDGTLWVGTARGLASLKDGALIQYPEAGGSRILRLVEDSDGVLWVAAYGAQIGRLCAIRTGRVECFGADGRFGRGPFGLYRDRLNRIWAGVLAGVWRWTPDPPQFYSTPGEPNSVQALVDDGSGALLISTHAGIRRLENGQIGPPLSLPDRVAQAEINHVLRDRDGGLWIGTAGRGIARLHNGRTDVFGQSDGLSSDRIGSLYEDREGNVWVATAEGLDRFRQYAVARLTAHEGLSGSGVMSVLSTKDDSVWIATDAGLNRWHDGRIAVVDADRARDRKAGGGVGTALFQDSRGRLWVANAAEVAYLENGRWVRVNGVPRGQPFTVTQDTDGNMWISYQGEGLVRISPAGAVQTVPWSRFGHEDPAVSLLADERLGGVWLGFPRGGIVHFAGDEILASYGASNGVAASTVNNLRFDSSGTLWAATENGLIRLKNGHGTTISGRNGLPCDAVNWVIEDNAGSLWLQLPCGLVRIPRSELDAWSAAVDRSPELTHSVGLVVFDAADGARAYAGTGGVRPLVTKSSDGRLWFKGVEGLSVIDPNRIAVNAVPPPVAIEQITADRQPFGRAGTGGRSALPARARDLQIDYTALSFVAPEKVRFRYKLENHDTDWQDVGGRRQAFYNDLPPGQYRFRVIASNNSGVWNEAGAFLDFSIAPAYYETAWFRAASVATILIVLGAAYRFRVRQLAHDFNLRLDERVNERTRIARELHDTLLQSFQGLMLRFQSARSLLPEHPAKAVEALDGALDRADRALAEGRDAIQNLRSPTIGTNELAQAMTTLADELTQGHAEKGAAMFRISVEGSPRDLHPIVRDDIHRIACEALRNAYRHAQAEHIEAEVTYSAREVRLRIRDDGKGIDPQHLKDGREMHWGLTNMRERAQRIGSKLSLWSEAGAGTEVELRVPGSLAYGPVRRRGWFSTSAGHEGNDQR
jgi:ligand-binding sensor domain-containing protein/signal transduction histidine kinase